MLAASGAPTFTPQRAVAAVVSNALLLVQCGESQWQAVRHIFSGQRWETMTLPELAPVTNAPLAMALAEGLMLLGGSTNGGVGLAYDAKNNQWRVLATHGWPELNWQEARGVGLPDGCLVLGVGPSGLQMSRYHLTADRWENLSTNGFNLTWSPALCSLWTGAEWYWMENRPAGWRGVRYHLASNLWATLPLEGAPAGHTHARCLWTGAGLMVVNLALPPAEGVIPSAIYSPQTDHWRPMTTAAPWSPFGPPPYLVVTGDEVLLVQVSDPSKFAAYHLAMDRWRPLAGPTLGFEAFLQWTGRQLLALPVAPPAEMEHLLYRYTPPLPVGLFQLPRP